MMSVPRPSDVGCPGHARHWFAIWGAVGLRSPVCVRCGAPNPRKLTADEWAELIDFVSFTGRTHNAHVMAAIAAADGVFV